MESPARIDGAYPAEASERVKLPLLLDPPFSCHWKVPSEAEVKDRVVVSSKLVVKVPEFPFGLQV